MGPGGPRPQEATRSGKSQAHWGPAPKPAGGPSEPLWGEGCPPGDLFPRLLQPVDGVALQGREDGVEGGEILEDPALLGGKGTGHEGDPACLLQLGSLSAGSSLPEETDALGGALTAL